MPGASAGRSLASSTPRAENESGPPKQAPRRLRLPIHGEPPGANQLEAVPIRAALPLSEGGPRNWYWIRPAPPHTVRPVSIPPKHIEAGRSKGPRRNLNFHAACVERDRHRSELNAPHPPAGFSSALNRSPESGAATSNRACAAHPCRAWPALPLPCCGPLPPSATGIERLSRSAPAPPSIPAGRSVFEPMANRVAVRITRRAIRPTFCSEPRRCESASRERMLWSRPRASEPWPCHDDLPVRPIRHDRFRVITARGPALRARSPTLRPSGVHNGQRGRHCWPIPRSAVMVSCPWMSLAMGRPRRASP